MTSIDNAAFYCCKKLRDINIPNRVTTIYRSTFAYCESLATIIIPDNVTSIEDFAFHNCSNLRSVNIPNSVTTIGYAAFRNCINLTSVDIPYGVRSIRKIAFEGCSNLTSINIPNSVTDIADTAFPSTTRIIRGEAGSKEDTHLIASKPSSSSSSTSSKPSSSSFSTSSKPSYSSSSSTSSPPSSYLINARTESDGFKWAQYSDLDLTTQWMGALDANNKVIIPASKKFSFVRYSAVKGRKGYFDVTTLDNKRGVYDVDGNEKIPPIYEYILFSESENCFKYEKGDDFIKLPYTITSSGKIVSASTASTSRSSSSYSSSSSSSSSSYSTSQASSQYGRLLYSGTYTNTGVVRNSTNVSANGNPSLITISIYEKALIAANDNPAYYQGNLSIYGETGRKYAHSNNDNLFWFVTNNGFVRVVSVITNTFPIVGTVTETSVLYLDAGDTRASYAGRSSGQNNGQFNSFNGGGSINNSSGSSKKPICKTCLGQKVCRNCNGTKRAVNPFTNRSDFCEICKGTGVCPTCNGTGESPYRH